MIDSPAGSKVIKELLNFSGHLSSPFRQKKYHTSFDLRYKRDAGVIASHITTFGQQSQATVLYITSKGEMDHKRREGEGRK